MRNRPPDSEVPLSYLHAEYADKCRVAGREPMPLREWALDAAHAPAFHRRADVVTIREQENTR